MAAKSEILASPSKGGGGLAGPMLEYYVQNHNWIAWTSADGVATRTLVHQLARNALVRRFIVRVGAARADRTPLDSAGQVRLQTESGNSKILVVDFGMVRTVSGVGTLVGQGVPTIRVCSLRAFRGDGFDNTDLYFEDCDSDIDGALVRTEEQNSFETRTERVRIKLDTSAGLAAIAANVWLQFPDFPTDLDLRVNNGPPAWTAPGMAQPSARGWDAKTQQVADLTEALAKLTGDPRDASALDASIVLASRVPGLLTLAEEAVDIAYVARIAFPDAEETTLALDQEGERDLVLPLPAWVKAVQEVRMTLTGSVPPERVLEPVGPPPALRATGDGAAYDLVLDVDHAGAVRFDVAAPLGELVAVRLPLRAAAQGAEVRAVLHKGTPDGPARPVDGGTSKAVDLAPAPAGSADVWTSFPLPKPVKLDPALTYWVVVVAGRGAVSWSLGRFATPGAAVPIRRGAAAGPWHELPSVVVDGGTLGGRIRAVGKARPSAPVAPLTVTVVGPGTSRVDVTPAPKGASVTWLAPGAVSGTQHPSITPAGPAGAPTITLRVTNRMIGTVKLGAVDVVATK